jgi:hypothetical protein
LARSNVADVLIHVVDASGSTDKEGVQLGAGATGNPAEDINWVREEIHRHAPIARPSVFCVKKHWRWPVPATSVSMRRRWIYNNVMAKWESIQKRPDKLLEVCAAQRSMDVTGRALTRAT